MPVEVENRLPRSGADVDRDAVVLETGLARRLGDELEHALGLLGRELADLAEARDMTLGQDEQVCLRLRVDVANGDEAVGGVDVVALGEELAEQAIVRQRGSPPRSPRGRGLE
jgi:hypothetical protein